MCGDSCGGSGFLSLIGWYPYPAMVSYIWLLDHPAMAIISNHMCLTAFDPSLHDDQLTSYRTIRGLFDSQVKLAKSSKKGTPVTNDENGWTRKWTFTTRNLGKQNLLTLLYNLFMLTPPGQTRNGWDTTRSCSQIPQTTAVLLLAIIVMIVTR